jgi:hypothetical protein
MVQKSAELFVTNASLTAFVPPAGALSARQPAEIATRHTAKMTIGRRDCIGSRSSKSQPD